MSTALAGGLLSLHHSSTVVADVDAAVRFQRDAFGFEVLLQARDLTDPIRSMLGVDGLRCDLVQGRLPVSGHILEFIAFSDVPDDCDPALPVRAGQGHLAYVVEDLAATLDVVTAAGARRIGKVTEFAEGPAVYCWMPAGGVIEIEQHHAGVGS